MARLERKLLFDSLLVGAGITLLVILCDLAGLLTPLENWLYDHRARWCQFFLRKPTDQLVHVDIDDGAIDVLGRWPWHRAKWAPMLEELRAAGARVVAFDVGFAEVEEPRYVEQPGGGAPVRVDDDAEMAAAMRRCGNVILPVAFDPAPAPSLLYARMVEELKKNPRLTQLALTERLKQQLAVHPEPLQAGAMTDAFIAARRDALHELLSQGLSRGQSLESQRDDILTPRQEDEAAAELRWFIDEQINRLRVERAVQRFGVPPPRNFPAETPTKVQLAPVLPLLDGASGVAFANYEALRGGVVRSVPLLLVHDGRMYAGLGLRLACAQWGISLESIRIEQDAIVITRTDGASCRIPFQKHSAREPDSVGLLVDVPWVGAAWQTMYDHPSHALPVNHFSVTRIWQICEVTQRIRQNNANIDWAIRTLLDNEDDNLGLSKSRSEAYDAHVPAPDDTAARVPTIEFALAELEKSGYLDQFRQLKENEFTPRLRKQRDHAVDAANILRRVPEENERLAKMAEQQRAQLAGSVRGRAVLIGMIATGALDKVPTSLHDQCPGVVVHGAVFNGIMTGELWRRAPVWVAGVITLVLGLLTALVTGYFSAVRALAIALGLAAAYGVINGIVLFDYGDRIVGAAGPLLAIGFVWAGCGVTRAIVETAERNRITRRFQSYVDPELVNYVLEHPQDARLEGQSREMTVVFTDLAGFTTLSEQLKEKVVPILNEFLGRMVPIIRRHRGYVNKFLGDGIMFFMGAPAQNPNDAIDAVAAICDMQKEVAAFSLEMESRGLPAVKMRAGVATGQMVVGDAGSVDASDYTVLGDTVNFAARLQSANKATDTLTLVSARTAELLGDQFLLRPVGKLRVVGKTEGLRSFELIGPADAATERDRRCVEATRAMIESFLASRFDDALTQAGALEGEFGRSELIEMYRELSQQYLQNPPANGFDGTIVLSEK